MSDKWEKKCDDTRDKIDIKVLWKSVKEGFFWILMLFWLINISFFIKAQILELCWPTTLAPHLPNLIWSLLFWVFFFHWISVSHFFLFFFFLLISQFQLYFLPLCSVTHAVMPASFFSSLCRSLYPNPSFSSPPFYLPPSLLPRSVTLGRFLNLKLDLKSQISSFCCLTPHPIPSSLSSLPHSSSVSLRFLSSSLHPIYS